MIATGVMNSSAVTGQCGSRVQKPKLGSPDFKFHQVKFEPSSHFSPNPFSHGNFQSFPHFIFHQKKGGYGEIRCNLDGRSQSAICLARAIFHSPFSLFHWSEGGEGVGVILDQKSMFLDQKSYSTRLSLKKWARICPSTIHHPPSTNLERNAL